MTKARMKGLFVAVVTGMTVLVTAPSASFGDSGKAPTTLSFFSGGQGAHADWLATDDQPPLDTDNQAIRLLTTNGAPTFEQGYAGILFHHVTGIPADAFPDSEFWNKAPSGATVGSPRLVVAFQNVLGQFDGYGALRENARLTNDWEQVSDVDTYPNSAWDVMGGPCGFMYNVHWPTVQGCFTGHTVLSVFIVADAYGIYHLIDDIEVNGKTFSSASDNGNGKNDPAGPDATTDPSLLPPLALLAVYSQQ
jgi:hypothetical protein